MLGFLGGNLADGYTGRMEMVFISLGLKILGGVFMFAAAVVGDGLYDDDDIGVMADFPPFASPTSFNSSIFTIIGIVLRSNISILEKSQPAYP